MNDNNLETIVLGGGCFWCTEAVFQMLKGVESVLPGYAGGHIPRPSYEQVSAQITGHAEVVQIKYNPKIISLNNLLSVFFTVHDPTTRNRQGNDMGTQYRSVIYCTSKEQEAISKKFIGKLKQSKVFLAPILTEVKPLDKFYEAEPFHRNFYWNNEDDPYCQVVISPKLQKLKENFSHLI